MSYKGTINLKVFAGIAKPNPKMGQALGPLGLNMMKFCDEFNKKTSHNCNLKFRAQYNTYSK